MQVTIADNGFIGHSKSAFVGEENLGLEPQAIEWVSTNPFTARFVTDSLIKEASGPGQVAWLMEPYFMHPENYLKAMSMDFDAVLVHNRYFATGNRWLWCPHGGSWVAQRDWGFHPKTKNVSILLSDKKDMAGHELRHEIVKKYATYFDDILGLNQRVRPIEAYAPYRYSVIVENDRAPGYFTEKLIDCLTVGTVPIYWGDPEIGEIFHDGGIMQFDGIGDLIYHLDTLGQKDYDKRMEAIRTNWRIAQIYAVCEDRMYERYPHLFGG